MRALLATLLLVAGLAPAAALWGPPAICHPVDIGDAVSLPWGDGAFELDPEYDRERLVPDVVALLEGSDDLLVHMETLRRAAILTTGLATPHAPSAREREARGKTLLEALTRRVDAALAGAPTEVSGERALERQVGRALFDLGYARAALSQAGLTLDDDGRERLLKAAVLLRHDPAAQLGVVLATCGQADADRDTWRHLDNLFALVHDREDAWAARVARNATRIVGPFVGATDREQLAALARRQLEHG